MPKYDGSIRINTKIETKDLNSQMMRVSNAIKKDSAALDSLNRKICRITKRVRKGRIRVFKIAGPYVTKGGGNV